MRFFLLAITGMIVAGIGELAFFRLLKRFVRPVA